MRAHGRILSRIWNDPEFVALEGGPQRLYLFLLSQPDLSHAGLVPLRIRRWAQKASAYDGAALEKDLGVLEDARFVLADHDTQEVLVRTFVRNDGVYKQPLVMQRMREDAQQIDSPRLRAMFLAELDRLPLHELSDEPSRRGDRRSVREWVASIVDGLRADFADVGGRPQAGGEAVREPTLFDRSGDPPQTLPDTLSEPPADPPETVPDTLSGGSAGPSREGTRVRARVPLPPTPYPLPPKNTCSPERADSGPPPEGSPGPADAGRVSTEDAFAAFWSAYPRKVGKGQALKAYRAATKKADPDRILAGLNRHLTVWASAHTATQFVPYPATWLNGERWADDLAAPASTADAARSEEQLTDPDHPPGPGWWWKESRWGSRWMPPDRWR